MSSGTGMNQIITSQFHIGRSSMRSMSSINLRLRNIRDAMTRSSNHSTNLIQK